MARKAKTNNDTPEPQDEHPDVFADGQDEGHDEDAENTGEDTGFNMEDKGIGEPEEELTDDEIRANALHGEHEAGAHVTDLLDAEEARQAAEANSEGAEHGEHVFDPQATREDTDNTHQDGGEGFHVEEYHDANETGELAVEEAKGFNAAEEDSDLHPGSIARRINMGSNAFLHASLAPANRDPTIVGEHPEAEKGLRPLAPVDNLNRSDDAGRPFDGGYLHTVDKGTPHGMGVIEHIPAPTATGSIPEGLTVRAAVPLTESVLDPARIGRYQRRVGDSLTLNDQHVALIDAALNLKRRGVDKFTLAQAGGSMATAKELEDAGLFQGEDVLGHEHFPQSGRAFTLIS